MKMAVATIKGVSPYSQSRHYTDSVPHLDGESHADYEKRTWRHRLHVNDAGHVEIPPMSFKNMMPEAAKYRPRKVKGAGQATYTKCFEAGLMVLEPLVLDVKADDVPGEWLYVPADGKRGGPKRVSKCFPVIKSWGGKVTFHIIDDAITEDIFMATLRDGGQFIGLGRFRPRNNGYYGRFEVTKLEWSNA